jgi:hypothetical protein
MTTAFFCHPKKPFSMMNWHARLARAVLRRQRQEYARFNLIAGIDFFCNASGLIARPFNCHLYVSLFNHIVSGDSIAPYVSSSQISRHRDTPGAPEPPSSCSCFNHWEPELKMLTNSDSGFSFTPTLLSKSDYPESLAR